MQIWVDWTFSAKFGTLDHKKSSLREAESGFVLDLTGSFALRVQDDSVKGDPGINPG